MNSLMAITEKNSRVYHVDTSHLYLNFEYAAVAYWFLSQLYSRSGGTATHCSVPGLSYGLERPRFLDRSLEKSM